MISFGSSGNLVRSRMCGVASMIALYSRLNTYE